MNNNKLTKNHSKQYCESCLKLKQCKMYVLQNMEAAFVCDDCRNGKKK